MKKSLLFLLPLLLWYGCKEDPIQPPVNTGSNYFPVKADIRYEYDLRVEREENNYSASRSITHSSLLATFRNVQYNILLDSFFVDNSVTINQQFLRTTEGGVYLYIDTTGLTASIPPDLLPNIHVDTEFRFLALPLTQANEWIAYRIELRYQGASVPLVEVKGFRIGDEQIDINLRTGVERKNATKVRFDATLRIPDPENPFSFNTATYSANLWFSNDIGLVRVIGNSLLLNVLTGGSLSFQDTSSVATQDLRAYFIPK